jgi:hypothetical protein
MIFTTAASPMTDAFCLHAQHIITLFWLIIDQCAQLLQVILDNLVTAAADA